MGICRYCQKKAGWFADAHDACVQKANAEREYQRKGIEFMKTCVADAVISGKQYSEVSAAINKLKEDAPFRQTKYTRQSKRVGTKGQKSGVRPSPLAMKNMQLF